MKLTKNNIIRLYILGAILGISFWFINPSYITTTDIINLSTTEEESSDDTQVVEEPKEIEPNIIAANMTLQSKIDDDPAYIEVEPYNEYVGHDILRVRSTPEIIDEALNRFEAVFKQVSRTEKCK